MTVSGVGLSSGTYREISSTSYYYAAGTDYHELYLSDGAWFIVPALADYPRYRVSNKGGLVFFCVAVEEFRDGCLV